MFQIGQTLGDYSILQELGKGGFGRVYKVEHTITGRREAMKVLSSSTADAAEQAERFLREIRLQASLSHPNIAAVHTAFWVNDDLALVCELLEGRSLQRVLEEDPPSQKRGLEIIAQVLDALSYAHARGIIHRDISPGNIFVTAVGTVKIIDFGLAKAATDLRLTREGSPVGAAHYMSPEQVRGSREIDARTDIYSAGVVLYEVLTGKKPFEGEDAFTIMKAHTEEPPPSPTAANPQIPSALSVALLRSLAKKAEDRFQSADAFLQAIKEINVEPVQASTRSSLSQPILIGACTVLVILVGFLVAAATTRTSNAQSQNTKSFVVPPPPVVVTPDSVVPNPSGQAVETPVPAPAKTAPKTQRHRKPASVVAAASGKSVTSGKSVASAALVEPLGPPAPESTITPNAPSEPSVDSAPSAPSAASDGKPRSGVVRVLKKINPFQGNSSTAHKDDAKK